MPDKTYIREGREYYTDTNKPVWSHRHRQLRDGVTVDPEQELKDDPEVTRILNLLDNLERRSRPSLGVNVTGKDLAAFEALTLAGELVDYVAGWAIDHQRGLAQQGVLFTSSVNRSTADDDHVYERDGSIRAPLDPVQERKCLFNLLYPMAGSLGLNFQIVEAIEALDYGETLPVFQASHTPKRTGLITYLARLCAIAFIEYESGKGIKKRVSTDEVMEAFAVTRDSVKDWRAQLRSALGTLRVDITLKNAREAGEFYLSQSRKTEDELAAGLCHCCEELYGKPDLLRAAKRYKARSIKDVKKST